MSRKRRRRKVGKHISLSATDADWETVRSNANRRGLSIARYLVELVERDASEEEGCSEELCAALASVVGEERARSCRERVKAPQAGEGRKDPRQDQALCAGPRLAECRV